MPTLPFLSGHCPSPLDLASPGRLPLPPPHPPHPPAAWLAMVITYTTCLGLTLFIVRATQRSWDYVTTTSILHFLLAIIGTAHGSASPVTSAVEGGGLVWVSSFSLLCIPHLLLHGLLVA